MTESPTGTPAAVPATAPAAPSQPSVDIAAIPDDVLMKDPRFNTMVGRHAKRLADQQAAQIKADADAKAVRDQEEAMIALARQNPFEFTNKWLGDNMKEIARRELGALEEKTQTEILNRVGAAFSDLPEWNELKPEDFAEMATRLGDRQGADLIAAFNTAAFDKVTEKRAAKKAASEVQQRIKAEREAWERETAAARMRGEVYPDMRAPGAPGRFDPSRLSDADFEKWYMTEGPGKNL